MSARKIAKLLHRYIAMKLNNSRTTEQPVCRQVRSNNRKSKGFTLIELLVVIGIISVLTALLTANFVGVRQRARDAQRKADLRQIQSALEIFRADNGSYPASESGVGVVFPDCGKAFTGATGSIYMQKVPCDPLGGSYKYALTNSSIYSYNLIACLENNSDSQKDTTLPNPNPCNQSTNFSYTLVNP